ncbi:carbohydrate ABC transporter permease, partial [Candidatus Acetothermia bacterium]
MSFRRLQRQTLIYMAAIVVASWVLLPIVLIALASFTPQQEIYQWPKSIIPSHFSLETMKFFLNSYGVLPSLLNSVLVALMTLGITLIVAAPAGYAVARFTFRGRNVYRMGILMTRMFPTALLAIPLAVTF